MEKSRNACTRNAKAYRNASISVYYIRKYITVLCDKKFFLFDKLVPVVNFLKKK